MAKEADYMMIYFDHLSMEIGVNRYVFILQQLIIEGVFGGVCYADNKVYQIYHNVISLCGASPGHHQKNKGFTGFP